MKVLIVGCGRVGSRLAQSFDVQGHDVTIIDRDPGAFDRFARRGVFSPDSGVQFVVGDGTDSDLLLRCGAETCDAFVAVTEGDNRNIMAAQIARHVHRIPRVVCRIYDPVREEAYRHMGMHSFCPTVDSVGRVQKMLAEEGP